MAQGQVGGASPSTQLVGCKTLEESFSGVKPRLEEYPQSQKVVFAICLQAVHACSRDLSKYRTRTCRHLSGLRLVSAQAPEGFLLLDAVCSDVSIA